MLVSTLETIEAAMARESRFPAEPVALVETEGAAQGVSSGTKEVAGVPVCRVGAWARSVAVTGPAAASPTRVQPLPRM